MKVLAFDLGSTFGWALGYSSASPTVDICGQELAPGERPVRLMNFKDRVSRIIERRRPDLVVYERPFARGEAATRSLWGMAGVLEAVATEYKAAVVDAASPSTVKKFWTGNHQASKDEMIAEARRRGITVAGEHDADACAVLLYTLTNLETE